MGNSANNMKIQIFIALISLSSCLAFINKGNNDSKNDLTCSVCMTLMELLDSTITDPTNEQQVAEFLDQICNFMPDSLKPECHALIMEYTDDIIELLVNQYISPKQICDAISLCPKTIEKLSGLNISVTN